ncbi:MAG: ABC transporter substrate-binding protein [Chloroflexi bacterium]|nr:ABC transporter substrate-binding protein [Chloroflexota bacterium]
MKTFKSVLSVLIILTIVLAGCTPAQPTAAPAESAGEAAEPEQQAAEPVTITFWNGVGAPENEVFSKLVKEFNATNKDNITVTEVILDWDTLYSKILLDYQAGNAPDVVTMQMTSVAQNVDFGILAPLDELAAKYDFKKSDYVEVAWDGTIVNGKQYAIPYDMHPLALYYNVKMFEEAGLDPNNPPKPGEEWLDAMQKLTKDTDGDGKTDQYGLGLAYSGGTPFRVWMSLLWQHEGAELLTEDETKAAFNSAAGEEALQWLVDLVYTHKFVPEQEQSPDDDFAKGIVAMDISGPWSMFDFNKIDGLEYKVAPLPVVFDQPAVWANSHVLALPDTKDDARMEASMKFVRFLADNGMTWTTEAGHLPVLKTVTSSPEFAELENHQAFYQSLDVAHYYPPILKQNELFGREPNSPFVVLVETTLLNKGTVADTLSQVEQMVNDILAQ